jgi:mutator protein MutT
MKILETWRYCPVCGSPHWEKNSVKSMKCHSCGFEYFINPSAANAAFILNDEDKLLVVRRKKEPAKGTLDLPGGFADAGETAEEGVVREVKEETNLDVTEVKYLFSYPNIYLYSNVELPTQDIFFLCKVKDTAALQAMDDACDCQWVSLKDIHTEQFGLRSVRQGLFEFLERYSKI